MVETLHNHTGVNAWGRVNLMRPPGVPTGDGGSASAHTPLANCNTHTSRWHSAACKLGTATKTANNSRLSSFPLCSPPSPAHTPPLSYILPFHSSSLPSPLFCLPVHQLTTELRESYSQLDAPPLHGPPGAPAVDCERCCDALLNLATPHPLGSMQAPPPLAAASHSLPLFFLC